MYQGVQQYGGEIMADNKYRNLNNEEYWIKRTEERVNKHWKNIKNVEKELAKQYRTALEDIRQLISDLYTKYAKDNAISYQDAVKELTRVEMNDYHNQMQGNKPQLRQTGNDEIINEHEKLEKSTKLSRLQALMNQIMDRMLMLGHTEQVTMTDWLEDLYEDNYYQTIHSVQVGIGMGISFALLDEDRITQAITHPWSGDMFSSRIWDNKDWLVKSLRQTLIQGFIKGDSVQDMARKLSKEMDSGYAQSLRLVHTESAHVIGESTAQGYAESKYVDQYIILATLDRRTSSICRKQDNKVYKLSERQVGVNASPFHPFCRSTEAVYFGDDDSEVGERIAREESGKTYKVPANMNYSEWYNKYVNKGVA